MNDAPQPSPAALLAGVLRVVWPEKVVTVHGPLSVRAGIHTSFGVYGERFSAKSRDDLARVFVAAFEIQGEKWISHETIMGAWRLALHDPRAALCQLLDLLGIPVPDEDER